MLLKCQLGVLVAVLGAVVLVEAMVEEVEVDPSNTSGLVLGEISFPQFLLGLLVFILLTALYAAGVLPVEIDLGEKFFGDYYYEDEYYEYHGHGDYEMRANRKTRTTPTFLLDCPLQFVCEVDEWAHRDHQGLVENLVAYWFRNPKKRWRRPDATTFGGMGTCQEMHPCPFDVQKVVGFTIPGSNVSTPLATLSSASASAYVQNAVSPYSVF